jgi:hypothetical protein
LSLIDEALKRARDQTARPGGAAGSPRPGEDPWSYAPLPERRRRRPLAIGAVAAAGIIALVAAIVLVSSRPRSAGAPPDARPSASAATPASKTPGRVADGGIPASALPSPTPLLAAPPAKMSARGARSPGRALPAGASLGTLPGDSGLASASPRLAAPARSSRTLLSGDGAHPTERQRPPGRTYVGSLVAPGGARIELGGIVFSESSPVALVNGRILPVGGVIEGLRIVAIEENRVELSGEGFTAFLALK